MRSWEIQSAWNKIDETRQTVRAQAALKTCCQVLGIQDDARVIGVKDNDRFVLSYEQDPMKPDFGKHMIKLETLMREVMGVVVDLVLEPMEDKNKRAQRNGRA
jgi:hypothetical protein